MQAQLRAGLRRLFTNGHFLAFLAGGLIFSWGLFMEHQGVRDYKFADKYGRTQAGSPDLLYWLGGLLAGGAAISALLFRADQLKQERKAHGRAVNQRQRHRRHLKRAGRR